MEYQCLEDRVLIKKIKEQEGKKSEGGIITDTIQRQTFSGIVRQVGEGRYATDTGVFMPTILRKGDEVVLMKGVGLEIDDPDEKDLLLIRESDALMVIKK